jgi:PKD repeat protein
MRRHAMCGMLLSLCCLLLSGCIVSRDPAVTISMEPSSGYSPLLVHLEAHVADTASELLVYEWTFGDGASAAGAIVDHEFTGNGNISIRLTVTDAEGRQTVIDDAVRLLNRIPHAQFTFQPNPAPTHHPIRFDASESYDPDGEIVSYHWNFGDGDTASGPITDHEFQTPNTDYRVVLTVTDARGDVNSMYRVLELIGCDH